MSLNMKLILAVFALNLLKGSTALDCAEKVEVLGKSFPICEDWISVINRTITHIPDGTFSVLPKAEYLSLSLTLPVLTKGSFDGVEQLKKLYLSWCDISEIEPNAFQGLYSLWALDLSQNELTPESLSTPNIWSGLPSLTELDLSRNKLTSIDADMFKGLENLKELNLEESDIKGINNNAWINTPNLEILKLRGIQITKVDKDMFAGLDGLKELDLNHGSIKSIENEAFSHMTSLTELHLYKSQISHINSGSFSGLKSLKHLSFDYAQISSIEDGAFQDLSSLIWLYLEHNRLTRFPQSLFHPDGIASYLETRTSDYALTVKLGGNRLKCGDEDDEDDEGICWLQTENYKNFNADYYSSCKCRSTEQGSGY